MSETDNSPESPRGIDRRSFLRTVGVTAGAGAVGVSGVGPSVTQEGDALLPLLAAGAGGAVVGGALTALLTDADIFGSDPPPDSLGPSALKDQVLQTAKTRKSTNASTLTDNKNLITYVQEPAFVDGKVEAVKAINSGKTKAEVESAALTAANSHITTVEKNLLNSWNESVNELETMKTSLGNAGAGGYISIRYGVNADKGNITFESTSATLADGSSKSIRRIANRSLDVPLYWTPINHTGDDYKIKVGNNLKYLKFQKWTKTWSELQTVQTDVENNLVTWVDTAYNQVQSGTLRPSELLSPSDLSNEYQGENARAIADLQALNIPNAGGNEVTIEVQDEYTSRMTGLLAYSGSTSDLSEGDTVDPNATDESGNPVYSGSWYISHNTSKWTATTTQYHDSNYGLQGGQLRLTRDPTQLYGNNYSAAVRYQVQTNKGETASFVPGDTTKTTDGSGNTIWTVDLSDQLAQSTASVSQMIAVTTSEEAVYETVQLTDPFTVVSTSDGPVSFEQPREPQTDNNYLTPEEWDNFEQQTRSNIEAYESAQGGGVIGGGDLLGDLPTFPGLGAIETIVVVLGGGWLLGQLSNN